MSPCWTYPPGGVACAPRVDEGRGIILVPTRNAANARKVAHRLGVSREQLQLHVFRSGTGTLVQRRVPFASKDTAPIALADGLAW